MTAPESKPALDSPAVPAARPRSRVRVWLRRGAIAGALTLAMWVFFIFVLEIAGRSCPAPEGKYDLIVVAGAGLMPDGTPSSSQYVRSVEGVRLWKAGFAPKILFTGGTSPGLPAESEAGARIAQEMGVPPSAMILEDKSRTTYENAVYAREAAPKAQVILLVTDSYHVPRARRVFARFFNRVDASPTFTPLKYRFGSDIREVPKFAFYFLMGRL